MTDDTANQRNPIMFENTKSVLKRKLRPAILFFRVVQEQLKPKFKTFSNRPENAKRALLCYLLDAVGMKESDPRLKGHANWWRGRELARILDSLGYNVDAISSGDAQTIPSRRYDLILDASSNLPRLAPFQKPDTKYVLLLTGSYYGWSGPAEARRILDFERNHGVFYEPRNGRVPKDLMDKTISIADLCLLIGNEVTLKTYPEWARARMRTVQMPTSEIRHRKRYSRAFLDNYKTKTFLYYSSARNVCKGLDLVLDVFYRHPEWTLNVVGPVESTEMDFLKAYPDLHDQPNIRMYGSLMASSEKFARILDESEALLFPSCTEGTSSSVLTCLRGGIYPIISRNSGVDLPEGTGTWIETLTVPGVERAMLSFLEKDGASISGEAETIRGRIEERHSREAFTKNMTAILSEVDCRPKHGLDPAVLRAYEQSISPEIRNSPLFG